MTYKYNYFLVSLNAGSQTTEQIFSIEHVNNLDKQIIDLKQKLDRAKKEFNVK